MTTKLYQKNHFPKRIMLNGEWQDSYRRESEFISKHACICRTLHTEHHHPCQHSHPPFRRHRNKRKRRSSQPISINRSCDESPWPQGLPRILSDDSGYSGLPLHSPFRIITEMYDMAALPRHKNTHTINN